MAQSSPSEVYRWSGRIASKPSQPSQIRRHCYLRRYAPPKATLADSNVFQIGSPSCHNSSIAFAESSKAMPKGATCAYDNVACSIHALFCESLGADARFLSATEVPYCRCIASCRSYRGSCFGSTAAASAKPTSRRFKRENAHDGIFAPSPCVLTDFRDGSTYIGFSY